jgi:hypothetical protein
VPGDPEAERIAARREPVRAVEQIYADQLRKVADRDDRAGGAHGSYDGTQHALEHSPLERRGGEHATAEHATAGDARRGATADGCAEDKLLQRQRR